MKTPKEVGYDLYKEQMNYIEDCLSGLLAAGVPKEDIAQYYICRTRIRKEVLGYGFSNK